MEHSQNNREYTRRDNAIIAARNWIGSYEAADTPKERALGYATSGILLENAVAETADHYTGTRTKVTAAVVARRYPEFPRDLVDAYFWVRGLEWKRDDARVAAMHGRAGKEA